MNNARKTQGDRRKAGCEGRPAESPLKTGEESAASEVGTLELHLMQVPAKYRDDNTAAVQLWSKDEDDVVYADPLCLEARIQTGEPDPNDIDRVRLPFPSITVHFNGTIGIIRYVPVGGTVKETVALGCYLCGDKDKL